MSVLFTWEYALGAAVTLLWLWDLWRRRRALVPAELAPLHQLFADADLDDARFDQAAARLQATVSSPPYTARLDEAIERFIDRLRQRATPSLAHFNTVAAIQVRLAVADAEPGAEHGNEQRARCRAAADLCLAQPHWRALIDAGLESTDDATFYTAAHAADALGIDCSERHWLRLESRPEDPRRWFKILVDADAARTAAAVALAGQVLPLAQIAVSDGSGVESADTADDAETRHAPLVVLDLLLERLQDFPGQGRALLLTGFASPYVRSRHLALSAFAAWDASQRDQGLLDALRRAAAEEDDGSVQRHFNEVMAALDASTAPP